MPDTLETATAKPEWFNQVNFNARWYRYRLPIVVGLSGVIAQFAVYLLIVTLAQGWPHAIELFGQDAWLVTPIMLGFGVQVGLYAYLRGLLRRSSRRSKVMVGMGGGTSTAAMVACCAHHVADVLPLLGLSAAAAFLAANKIPFMFAGLGLNVIGSVAMLRTIRQAQRHLTLMENHST